MAVNRAPLALHSYLQICKHNFSTSNLLSNNWRKKQGLEPEINKFGPLSRLPDFSYVDGRPVPLSMNQQRKVKVQKKFCKKIVELSHELDVGLENYYKKQEMLKKEREAILGSKLKPKGQRYLKNQHD